MLHRAPRVVLNFYHNSVVFLQRIFNSLVAWLGVSVDPTQCACTPVTVKRLITQTNRIPIQFLSNRFHFSVPYTSPISNLKIIFSTRTSPLPTTSPMYLAHVIIMHTGEQGRPSPRGNDAFPLLQMSPYFRKISQTPSTILPILPFQKKLFDFHPQLF